MSGNPAFGLYLARAVINLRAANVHTRARYVNNPSVRPLPRTTIIVHTAKFIASFGNKIKHSTVRNFLSLNNFFLIEQFTVLLHKAFVGNNIWLEKLASCWIDAGKKLCVGEEPHSCILLINQVALLFISYFYLIQVLAKKITVTTNSLHHFIHVANTTRESYSIIQNFKPILFGEQNHNGSG